MLITCNKCGLVLHVIIDGSNIDKLNKRFRCWHCSTMDWDAVV